MLSTPILWGFCAGWLLRSVPLPVLLERGLSGFAWGVIGLSLVLIGMRLVQLEHWGNLGDVAPAISIKVLLMPIAMGIILQFLDLAAPIELVLVLQAGMPSAFSTLILAEEYRLDRDATVTAIASSSLALPLTLPVWLAIWGQGLS